MKTFSELYSRHAATAFARQLALADFLEGLDWQVSVSDGIVNFGDELQFEMQLLGTEAEGNQTWLWAWANEASQLPDHVLKAVQSVRRLGERHAIAELTEPSFPLTMADGHALSMVSAALVGRCCYYRGPYDGGAVFFLVMGLPESLFSPVRPERAATVITEVISSFAVDHVLMVQGFCKDQGFTIDVSGRTITARRPDGAEIEVQFDKERRIAMVESKVLPR